MATHIEKDASIPGPSSSRCDHAEMPGLDEGGSNGTSRHSSNGCVFPPVCLAVGSIVGPSEHPNQLSVQHRDDIAATASDVLRPNEFYNGDSDDDDEPRPGYAFVDYEDEYCDASHYHGAEECRGGSLDRLELVVGCASSAPREHGHLNDDDDDEDSHATSDSGNSCRTPTSGSTQDEGNEPSNTLRRGETSPNTNQLLAELMVRMRESRELAQRQRDRSMSAPTDINSQSTTYIDAVRGLRKLVVPTAHVVQPRCASRLGRSATTRLYPNVVASLGETSWNRMNEQRSASLLERDASTDSDDEDWDDSAAETATNYRFEIWRVHAFSETDGANNDGVCFQMWRARAGNQPRHQDGKRPRTVAEADDVKCSSAVDPASGRADAKMITQQVPVVCDWIRKLRNDGAERRIMILSTAEDSTARNNPSYQIVSNLILNPQGSKSGAAPSPSTKSESAPVDTAPARSSSHGLSKLWPNSKSGMQWAGAPPGKQVSAGAQAHAASPAATSERTQQLALDRLRCWKRRRPGFVVETTSDTDLSSSETVASF